MIEVSWKGGIDKFFSPRFERIMPKISVYVPAMKLKVIDAYCEEHKIARGVLLANAAMRVINAQGGVKCDYCKRNPSVGRYHVEIYNPDIGMEEKTLNLCESDLKKAKLQGVVKEE